MNSICNYLVATVITTSLCFPRNMKVYLELEQNMNANNPSVFIKIFNEIAPTMI